MQIIIAILREERKKILIETTKLCGAQWAIFELHRWNIKDNIKIRTITVPLDDDDVAWIAAKLRMNGIKFACTKLP